MYSMLIQYALNGLLFFGLHFEGKNKFPRQLSPREEAEVIRKIAGGDASARDALIVRNLRLVAYIVMKNYPEARDQDDLISIGTIGLIRAAETFDYEKGNHFSTYASKCIDNQIKMHFRKEKHRRTEMYINEPIDFDNEGNALTIADILSSDVDIEEEAALKMDSERLYRFIDEELDEREREIICKRYGIPDSSGNTFLPLTQREIAKQLGISRSYISRIEKKALEKLKKRFEEG